MYVVVQELCLALLSSNTVTARATVQQLRVIAGCRQHAPSQQTCDSADLPIQQQQNWQHQNFQHAHKKTDVLQTNVKAPPSNFRPAAAACTALAAVASLAVCGLAIAVLIANAAVQPYIALAAAVAAPASAAAAAGLLAGLAGMFTNIGCRPAAGVACSCMVALIACAASVVAAVFRAQSAAGQLISMALAAVAGFELLVAAAAALLLLSAEQSEGITEQASEQTCRRVVQAAAWQMLRRAMQRYSVEAGGSCSARRSMVASSCSGGSNDSTSCWHNVPQEPCCKETSVIWQRLVLKISSRGDPAKNQRYYCRLQSCNSFS